MGGSQLSAIPRDEFRGSRKFTCKSVAAAPHRKVYERHDKNSVVTKNFLPDICPVFPPPSTIQSVTQHQDMFKNITSLQKYKYTDYLCTFSTENCDILTIDIDSN